MVILSSWMSPKGYTSILSCDLHMKLLVHILFLEYMTTHATVNPAKWFLSHISWALDQYRHSTSAIYPLYLCIRPFMKGTKFRKFYIFHKIMYIVLYSSFPVALPVETIRKLSLILVFPLRSLILATLSYVHWNAFIRLIIKWYVPELIFFFFCLL